MNHWIQYSINVAQKAFLNNEVPIGAVIVNWKTKTLVTSAYNRTQCDNNPCGHAEILALSSAGKKLQTCILPMCDIYVSLEPCAMCAAAISYGRLRRLYFAAYNPKGGAIEHQFNIYNYLPHTPEIYGGMAENESLSLLKKFFIQKRKNNIVQ